MERKTPDKKALIDVLTELEFKTIAVRVMKDFFPGESPVTFDAPVSEKGEANDTNLFSTAAPAIPKIETKYEEVTTVDTLVETLLKAERIAFYMAMQGKDCNGIGFSYKSGRSLLCFSFGRIVRRNGIF